MNNKKQIQLVVTREGKLDPAYQRRAQLINFLSNVEALKTAFAYKVRESFIVPIKLNYIDAIEGTSLRKEYEEKKQTKRISEIREEVGLV